MPDTIVGYGVQTGYDYNFKAMKLFNISTRSTKSSVKYRLNPLILPTRAGKHGKPSTMAAQRRHHLPCPASANATASILIKNGHDRNVDKLIRKNVNQEIPAL